MANIRQIALLAGVSVTTVSRVLNEHPYVRPDKRQAVLEAMRQLDYVPNRNAVHLTKGRSDTIGVVMPVIDHPYYSRILAGMSAEALNAGYQLLLVQTGYSRQTERTALELIRSRQVDGLILASNSLAWAEIEPYAAYGPLLACGDTAGAAISEVVVDHYACFAECLRYLLRRGRRRIGYSLARPDSANSLKRQRAYADVLAEAGIEQRDDWRFVRCLDAYDGAKIARQVMLMKIRPDAIIITGDLAAVGFIAEARSLGLRIPEDVAVIGYDNQPVAGVFGLTSMDIGIQEMGRVSVHTMLQRIRDPASAPDKVKLAYRLIERSTV